MRSCVSVEEVAAEVTVALTSNVYVPVGVPGVCTTWGVPPPQALQNIAISRHAPNRIAARRFPAPASPVRLASSNAYSQNIRPNPVMLGGRTFPNGGADDDAVVDIATVTGADAVPFNVTELGVSVQVDSEGAPLHVRFTVWFSPPCGVTVTA